MCCLYTFLNNMQDFDKSWWIVRLHDRDVHMVNNLLVDNFFERYGCLNLVVFLYDC